MIVAWFPWPCFPQTCSSNTNPELPVIVAFSNSSGVVLTGNIWCIFKVKPPFSNSPGVEWTWQQVLLDLEFCLIISSPSSLQANLDFLRLGQVHKILPELQSYSAQRAAAGIKTVNELRQLYESKVMLIGISLLYLKLIRFPSVQKRNNCVLPLFLVCSGDHLFRREARLVLSAYVRLLYSGWGFTDHTASLYRSSETRSCVHLSRGSLSVAAFGTECWSQVSKR